MCQVWLCWNGQYLDRRRWPILWGVFSFLLTWPPQDSQRHKFHPAELESFEPSVPTLSWDRATCTAMGTLNFLQPGHITDQMKPCWSWYVLKFIPETNTWVSLSAIFLRLAGSSEEKGFGLSSFGKWWDITGLGWTSNIWQWVASIFPELPLNSVHFGDIFLWLKKKSRMYLSHNRVPDSSSMKMNWHLTCTSLKSERSQLCGWRPMACLCQDSQQEHQACTQLPMPYLPLPSDRCVQGRVWVTSFILFTFKLYSMNYKSLLAGICCALCTTVIAQSTLIPQ